MSSVPPKLPEERRSYSGRPSRRRNNNLEYVSRKIQPHQILESKEYIEQRKKKLTESRNEAYKRMFKKYGLRNLSKLNLEEFLTKYKPLKDLRQKAMGYLNLFSEVVIQPRSTAKQRDEMYHHYMRRKNEFLDMLQGADRLIDNYEATLEPGKLYHNQKYKDKKKQLSESAEDRAKYYEFIDNNFLLKYNH